MTDPGSAGEPLLLRFGRFELDVRLQELRREGVRVRLQPQPLKLLALLARRSGNLVTREEIRHALWGEGTFVDFEQGLAFCIRQIRAALGDDARASRYVQTLPRRGYRFVAPVQEVRSTSPAPRRPGPLAALLALLALPMLFAPSGARRAATAHAAPPDAELLRLTLTGRQLSRRCRPDQLRRGLELLEEALRRDPGYAPAWLARADAYTTLGDYGAIPPSQAFATATESALRALELDPSPGAAQVTLARLRAIRDWDWTRARDAYEQALAADPNDPRALIGLSQLEQLLGDAERALRHARRAIEADPLSASANSQMADVLLGAGRAAGALAQVDRTLELEPFHAPAHFVRARVLIVLQRPNEALASLERAAHSDAEETSLLTLRALALAAAGSQDQARRILAGLDSPTPEGRRPASQFERAMILVAVGDRRAALDRLERSVAAHEGDARWLLVDETLRSLHGEPRFQALAHAVGLRPRS